MSKLFYDIPLEEEYALPDGRKKLARIDLPHFPQIAEWLTAEWEKCKIHECFYGILKDKVKSCKMRCFERDKDGHKEGVARVTVEFIPGFRLSEKRRRECFEQLDGQMADGFGESYDFAEIPGTEGAVIIF